MLSGRLDPTLCVLDLEDLHMTPVIRAMQAVDRVVGHLRGPVLHEHNPTREPVLRVHVLELWDH